MIIIVVMSSETVYGVFDNDELAEDFLEEIQESLPVEAFIKYYKLNDTKGVQ